MDLRLARRKPRGSERCREAWVRAGGTSWLRPPSRGAWLLLMTPSGCGSGVYSPRDSSSRGCFPHTLWLWQCQWLAVEKVTLNSPQSPDAGAGRGGCHCGHHCCPPRYTNASPRHKSDARLHFACGPDNPGPLESGSPENHTPLGSLTPCKLSTLG